MKSPRFVHHAVRAARRFASTPVGRRALWKVTAQDFDLEGLYALAADQRLPLDTDARPVQARPPRGWEDGRLPPPVSRWSTAARLREAFRAGTSSPDEIADRILARLEREDFGESRYSPFSILRDEAKIREDARASAARWRAGSPRGPLDGIPVPIKDEIDMVGLPTLGGTRHLTKPATADAFVVRRLSEAGALLVGKTHATEWGLNPLGYNQHADFPRNVWRSDRGSGGSSTGTGVAVAAGFAPVALGSDGGGSIRIPAAFNGIYGLKPTYIRIGRTGDIWGASTVAHLGPLGASVEDLVLLMRALSGIDPGDPATADTTAAGESWQAALGRGVRGCRIGVLRSEWKAADPAVARLCEDALVELGREGAVLVDVEIPLARYAPAIGALVIGSETTANIADDYAANSSSYGDEMAIFCEIMRVPSAREMLLAVRSRAALRRQAAAALMGVDVLALPTTAQLAPPYALSEGKRAILDTAATAGATRFSFLGNLTGLPAGTMPVGMSDGLPVGLQIVGDAWDEASVIAVLAHAERVGIAKALPSSSWRSLL